MAEETGAQFTVGPGGGLTQKGLGQSLDPGSLLITNAIGSAGPGSAGPQSGVTQSEGGGLELSPEESALLGAMQALMTVQTQYAQTQLESFRRLLPRAEQLWQQQSDLTALQTGVAQQLLPHQHWGWMQANENFAFAADRWSTLNRLADRTLEEGMAGTGLRRDPYAAGQLNQIYDERRQTGTAALRESAEEMAAARGMRLTDTPIGGDYFLRNLSEFERGLGAEQAGAELGLMTQQQQIRLATAQFQRNLAMQANANRAMMSTGQPISGQSLGLPTVQTGDVGAAGALGALASQRNALINQQTSREGFQSAQTIAGINAGSAAKVANIAHPQPSSFQQWAPIIGNFLSGASGMFS